MSQIETNIIMVVESMKLNRISSNGKTTENIFPPNWFSIFILACEKQYLISYIFDQTIENNICHLQI